MDVQVSDRAGMMWLVSCACAAHESSACLARCIAYLVDPASSHMLVLKAKPCMCQYQLLDGQAANGSLHHLRLMWQHV